MPDEWRRLLSIFSARDRRRIGLLLFSTTASGLVQALGIASVMPFIAVVADPALVTENPYLARAVATFDLESTNQLLVLLGVFAFLMLLATNFLIGLNAWLTFRVCYLGEHDLARRLLRTYLARPYLQLLQRNSSELMKMLIAEIDRVAIGTLMAGIGVFADFVTTIFVVGLLLVINPWITLATFVVLSLAYLLIYLLLTPTVTRLGSEFEHLSTEIYRTAHEALGAAKEIKVRGREEHFVDRFSRPMLRSSRNAVRYSTLDILPTQGLELLVFGGLIATTIYLIDQAQDAGDILPMIAMFTFAAYRLVPALKGLFDGAEAIRFNMVAFDALWRDFTAPPAAPLPAQSRDLPAPRRSIRFEQVSFRYPGSRRETLTALELVIPAGTSVCLAGPTGAGKSTTVDLLLGLLDPTSGTITVDGEAISAANVRAWQQHIGYVPQVVYLIDDTVANNIALGVAAADIDQSRLERAARIAQLHDFVIRELPDGYRSIVGERGANLSGGQRQRIGLARALYQDPAVLILDEATNELDLDTETRILAEIRKLAGRTLVFVSHKPSIAAFCDAIVVLEAGQIIAHGTYAELTAPGCRHRSLLQETSL